ncbi:hypothetical protein PsorP6_006504 [Peronosclerospora sorghi]|uniref:Uncharacterized protein n=1 Tax=Peronosclerospora sorghi TaxID=230839 RepID=A0ACC0W3T0_9STRA|nr:hypothetical protein PsorP6_006504 [Peronosclerospora sorghi]
MKRTIRGLFIPHRHDILMDPRTPLFLRMLLLLFTLVATFTAESGSTNKCQFTHESCRSGFRLSLL